MGCLFRARADFTGRGPLLLLQLVVCHRQAVEVAIAELHEERKVRRRLEGLHEAYLKQPLQAPGAFPATSKARRSNSYLCVRRLVARLKKER